MAGVMAFQYIPGDSAVHNLDERLKIGLTLGLCLMASVYNGFSLMVLTLLLFVLLNRTGFKITRVFRELRIFLFLLILIFLSRAYSFKGELVSGFLPPVEHIRAAGVVIWRFALMICYSFLFTGTTRLFRINGALYKILKKVPFLPAARISTMVSLTLNFIPLILSQYGEIKDAAFSRGWDSCRNPLKKGMALVLPLFINIFRRADEMADALEARGYSGHVGEMDFKIKRNDYIAFLVVIIVFCIINYLEWRLVIA